MSLAVFHPPRRRGKHTLHAALWGVCTALSGALMLSGCATATEAAETAKHHFNADSSLLGAGSSTTYIVSDGTDTDAAPFGLSDSPDDTDARESEGARAADPALPAPYGTLTVSNGMITSAELVASVETIDDMRFVLTEPALFERRGEVLDSIHAFGTLSTTTAMYPDTRITLTPEPTANGTLVNATVNVPESLTAEGGPEVTTVRLAFFMEPLATFEDATSSDERESGITPDPADPTRPQEAGSNSGESRPE